MCIRDSGIGAVVNIPGLWAWTVCPKTVARTESESSLARSSELINTAAAPSEIEEELAAVTVPSFLNAGFKFGIFSGCAFLGCSSSLMVM